MKRPPKNRVPNGAESVPALYTRTLGLKGSLANEPHLQFPLLSLAPINSLAHLQHISTGRFSSSLHLACEDDGCASAASVEVSSYCTYCINLGFTISIMIHLSRALQHYAQFLFINHITLGFRHDKELLLGTKDM
ncbi:hypothetical protein KC19_9G098400 [Ceratodon purpureus]|uniref:Uncharacterized protein n=1 Tax=Ceratodon purpureus TaxID=3225 RepID=A0A8T0GQI1_CERPU|nr:hypothetical protein KC19_9G098400 [Ceratodon purpureus]